jgi:DNA repair protein RecO (recombination protein O)
MASRNVSADCVVLRARDSGSGNRVVTLMTAEHGVIDALMYGGGKSKLRSLAAPYHEGRAWIYRDPVRDSNKLSDFDAKDAHEGARSGLSRSLHAALWAEILIRVRGGGADFSGPLGLLRTCLKALDSFGEEEAAYASIVFIWELAGLMGLRPDARSCARCPGVLSWDGVECFSPRDGAFICRECAAEARESGIQAVPAGTGKYLARAAELGAEGALRLRMDAVSREAAKRVSWALARRLAEGELNTLAMGEGIL